MKLKKKDKKIANFNSNMQIKWLFERIDPKKYKLEFEYDKSSKVRPAWIHFTKGLPDHISFLRVYLGKQGKEGVRNQEYKKYLPKGLFLPIDYTKEEMKKFYDRFSSFYDEEMIRNEQNLRAVDFLIPKLKKYIKHGEFLDLGAGTGVMTEKFVKAGFGPATLVDFSDGMLTKAKERKHLRGSKFIKADIRKLNLNKEFDLIISIFSFGSSSYFNKEELSKIVDIACKHLKKEGILLVFGHSGNNLFENKLISIEKGIYTLNKDKKLYVDYFIGRR